MFAKSDSFVGVVCPKEKGDSIVTFLCLLFDALPLIEGRTSCQQTTWGKKMFPPIETCSLFDFWHSFSRFKIFFQCKGRSTNVCW